MEKSRQLDRMVGPVVRHGGRLRGVGRSEEDRREGSSPPSLRSFRRCCPRRRPRRLWRRYCRAWCVPRCVAACAVFRSCGWQRAGGPGQWPEEFADAADIPAGPPRYHDSSVLEHTARLMDTLAGAAEVLGGAGALCVWMALCHDLGKTLTPRTELPRHIGHEARGESLALALCHGHRLPLLSFRAGAVAARCLKLAGDYPTLRPTTRVDLLFRLKHRAILREMFLLARADKGVDHLQEALADLAVAEPLQLPQELCGLGAESGARLRQMRIAAVRSRLKNTIAER